MQINQQTVSPVSLVAILQADFNRNRSLRDNLRKLLTDHDGNLLSEVHIYGIGDSFVSLEKEIIFGFKAGVIRHPSVADGIIIYEQEKHYAQL